jgi:hypothetical protein
MLVNEEIHTSLTPDKVHTVVEDYRRQRQGLADEPAPERAL